MAIYQFHMVAIPKMGITDYLGEIPKKLEIDFQKRTESFMSDKDEFDYFEFIQHKCWGIAEINPREIISQLDQKLDRANWGNDRESNTWKTETNEVDNDARIVINPKQNQIMEFTFRADLRQPKLKFLKEMIELSKDRDLLLVDIKGNVTEPEINKVIELIEKSNAFKFVINPTKFLADLEEDEIELE